jgi:hypothetical protein
VARDNRHGRGSRRRILRLQAAYYGITGMLPLLSMPLFEAITGPKRDRWLVQMVGLLAASIGLSLWLSSLAESDESASLVLSCSSALAFAGIDVTHVCRRRISPIYLADAGIELLIVGLMLRSASDV